MRPSFDEWLQAVIDTHTSHTSNYPRHATALHSRTLPTVYPKKYAHGFCFAVLCCGYTLTDFPISIRLTSLALWQSNDCPSASKATLMNMDKYFMWIHYERLHNHKKQSTTKPCAYFLGYTVGICYHWARGEREGMQTVRHEINLSIRLPIVTRSPFWYILAPVQRRMPIFTQFFSYSPPKMLGEFTYAALVSSHSIYARIRPDANTLCENA